MWNFPNTPIWDATMKIQADLKRVKSPSISVDIKPFISFFSPRGLNMSVNGLSVSLC